jgi:peptidoglycan hydrolase FlgJ
MSIAIGNDSLIGAAETTLNTSNNTNKLESKLKDNLDTSSDKELMDVCKSFESYFVEQMFKEMKKTVPDNEEENNQYLNYFGDMLNQKYADEVTETGDIGIAQMLYDSMKRNK